MFSGKPTSLYYRWCPSSVQTDPRHRRLTLKQHGFYRLLLDAMWQHENCRVEDSYQALRHWIPGSKSDHQDAIFALLTAGLIYKDSVFLYSKELESEANEAHSKSKAARDSATRRWGKISESLSGPHASAERTQSERNAQTSTVQNNNSKTPPISPSPAVRGKHALPDNFQPSPKHEELARELGVNLEFEFERFRDYFNARGKLMKDWEATFRNWIREEHKRSTRYAKSLAPSRATQPTIPGAQDSSTYLRSIPSLQTRLIKDVE